MMLRLQGEGEAWHEGVLHPAMQTLTMQKKQTMKHDVVTAFLVMVTSNHSGNDYWTIKA
jgi:hypothetical protein